MLIERAIKTSIRAVTICVMLRISGISIQKTPTGADDKQRFLVLTKPVVNLSVVTPKAAGLTADKDTGGLVEESDKTLGIYPSYIFFQFEITNTYRNT